MLRRKPSRYTGPAYPATDEATLDRRQVLAGLGAVAGLAATTVVGGGCFEMQGMVAGPEFDTFRAHLPDEPEFRMLYLGHGYFSYRLRVEVGEEALADWVDANRESLLDDIDAQLSTHPIETFAPDASLVAVEAELRQLLADLHAGVDGAPLDDWFGVYMTVDEYDEEEEMDGMLGVVE